MKNFATQTTTFHFWKIGLAVMLCLVFAGSPAQASSTAVPNGGCLKDLWKPNGIINLSNQTIKITICPILGDVKLGELSPGEFSGLLDDVESVWSFCNTGAECHDVKISYKLGTTKILGFPTG